MTQLISKLQYKNFESGEFIEIAERNYDETIELIEKFPWNDQRDKIVIDLTNPSVTIEGRNNDFLKVALFFNQKYVLHYFDENQVLYTKSFNNLKDGYECINNFFIQSKFDTTEFKKENTWLQHNLKHFVTQDFKYMLTAKSVRKYLLSTSGMNFFLSIVILSAVLLKGLHSFNIIALMVIVLAMFLLGGGVHLIIFFKYYYYLKDKVLIMSKGNDVFYFGNIDNPVKYDKKDIFQYITIRSKGSKNQFSGFAIVEIEFKNGTVLKIPNLLVDYSAIETKLFEYPRIDANEFPLLRL